MTESAKNYFGFFLRLCLKYGFNPVKTGTKLNISTWKRASKTTKLLDFLHFNLTNPMVPNLSNEFLSVWVSGTVLRGTYYGAVLTEIDP